MADIANEDFDVPEGPIDDIGTVEKYEDIVPMFDEVIAWAIDKNTPIGYFAVIYRQATVAIREAIKAKKFDDPDRMRKFQLIFAQRYFDAVNAYNRNAKVFTRTSHVWTQSFDDSGEDDPIIFQHLLTALNAHMNLDLGVAAAETAKKHNIPMEDLRHDFDVVNAVLGNQVESVLDVIDDVSPVIGVLRRWTPCNAEVGMFKALIVFFREMAWTFALKCHAAPDMDREIRLHDSKFVNLGTSYIYAPEGVLKVVAKIAKRESRDVPKNIKALNRNKKPSWSDVTAYRHALDALATS